MSFQALSAMDPLTTSLQEFSDGTVSQDDAAIAERYMQEFGHELAAAHGVGDVRYDDLDAFTEQLGLNEQ
jgi:hypothetical protein